MGSSKSKTEKAQRGDRSRTGPKPDVSIPILPIPDFDPGGLTTICGSVDASIKDMIKRLNMLQKACEEIKNQGPLEAMARGDRTGSVVRAVSELTAAMPGVLAEVSQLKAQVDAWCAGERRSRRSRFEEIARVLQWKLIGSWPEPVVNGIVFVSLDEPKDRAAINGRAFSGDLTAERIALAVAAELASLQQNLTEPAEFVAQVWKAYSARTTGPGAGVLVHDVLAELTWQRQSKGFQRDPRTDLFRGYSQAQFRADLTNYLAAGAPPMTVAGKSYELQVVGGSFAQEGIFMYFPQTERLATCGRISFQSLDADQGR